MKLTTAQKTTLEALCLRISHDFGKPICEVLRDLLEAEYYDYEIANILQIQVKHILTFRHQCKLKKANTARRRFREQYGPDAVERFKQIATDPLCTLTSIAEYFGFSRSNASIAYHGLFGKPYSDLKNAKSRARSQDRLKSRTSYEIARQAAKLLKRQGLKSEMVLNEVGRINLKSDHFWIKPMRLRQHKIGNQKYFSLHSTSGGCDFILGVHSSKIVYVFPISVLPGGRINIPTGDRESKYRQYRDAFHLLQVS